MFGNGQTAYNIFQIACGEFGGCGSTMPVSAFKKAPVATGSGPEFGDLEFGLHTIPAEVVQQLTSLYWPTAIGAALAFGLVVFGRQTASAYAVSVTFLVQMALVLAAQ